MPWTTENSPEFDSSARTTSPAASQNPSRSEVYSLFFPWHHWILIERPRMNHLRPNRYQIQAAQD
jgi:hypothetical protein